MKIAVLYICTGKYDIFWEDFYKSCEHNFCHDTIKHYFVFTDSKQISSNGNTSVIYQDNLGWPFNTLYRYRMFLRISNLLKEYDKIVFFNGNCLFKKNIAVEEFFGANSSLIACLHPGFYNKPVTEFTYETRENSTARVKDPHYYLAGGINGGDRDTFLEYCHILAENIETDLKNGIVALWHDESYWNALINNNYARLQDKLHLLSPAYLYPEGWNLPFECKILLRNKANYGNHEFLRNGINQTLVGRILRRLKIMLGKLT